MSKKHSFEDREFDIIVFGASGYTGTYIAQSMVKHAIRMKCALAGRNQNNLIKVLGMLRSMYENDSKRTEFIETVEMIIADVDVPASLDQMCKRTRLLINNVGPYHLYGKQVVTACVKNFTHYVDVCAEPQVLEEIQVEYFDIAKAKGIYVVGACGLDSVVCDLGIQLLKEDFDGDLNSVESYLQIKYPTDNTANFATWKSLILNFSHTDELKSRKTLKEKVFKKTFENKFPLKKKLFFRKGSSWCTPQVIGSDKSVATRTQLYDYEFNNILPVQIETYLHLPPILTILHLFIMSLIFMVLVKFEFGRNLLEKFPHFFSGGLINNAVPEREPAPSGTLLTDGFFSIVFEGEGWAKTGRNKGLHTSKPDTRIQSGFYFTEGPYTVTGECAVHCAIVLLTEPDKLPAGGGAFTPGALFMKTSLFRRLINTGGAHKLPTQEIPLK